MWCVLWLIHKKEKNGCPNSTGAERLQEIARNLANNSRKIKTAAPRRSSTDSARCYEDKFAKLGHKGTTLHEFGALMCIEWFLCQAYMLSPSMAGQIGFAFRNNTNWSSWSLQKLWSRVASDLWKPYAFLPLPHMQTGEKQRKSPQKWRRPACWWKYVNIM